MARIDCGEVNSICRLSHLLLLSISMLCAGCASNDELFAQYNSEFCAANHVGVPVVIEKEVVRDRVIVKEVPAAARQLTWEPAAYFDYGQSAFNESALDTLKNNASFLSAFPLYRISIRGFTDHHATTDYNRKLSEQRTDSVYKFFIKQGVDKSRLIVRAHGESIALSDDMSPVADEISRRVEMILLDREGRPAVTYQNVGSGAGG